MGKEEHPDVKSDLFSSFIVRIMGLANDHGECGIMCPFVWMFIGSYEKLRNEIIDNRTFTSLIQLEYSGFAGATVPICTFTFHNSHVDGYKGGYIRLSDFAGAAKQAPKAHEAIKNPDCGWFYRRDADTFKQIPGTPIAYWASDAEVSAFETMQRIEDSIDIRLGMTTADNERFVRLWWEISHSKETFRATSAEEVIKWCPYNKGGDFRKWYGNRYFVVNWEKNGEEIRNIKDSSGRIRSTVPNEGFYFRECLTWSKISSGAIAVRYLPGGSIFDVAGASGFGSNSSINRCIAFLNSEVALHMLGFLSPTLNFEGGHIRSLPLADVSELSNKLVLECIRKSSSDYDSFETSWDFKRHPLV